MVELTDKRDHLCRLVWFLLMKECFTFNEMAGILSIGVSKDNGERWTKVMDVEEGSLAIQHVKGI